MNKRDFIKGALTTAAATTIPLSPLMAESSSIFTVKNKIDLPVQISWELYKDVFEVYKFDIVTFFREHYGTSINIRNEKHSIGFYYHRLITNDSRDPEYMMINQNEPLGGLGDVDRTGWFIREDTGWARPETKFNWEV